MVRCDPPKTEQTIPPTIDAITPAIGGASEAMASPRPSGSATRDTTNPEKIFFGRELILGIFVFFLFILFFFNN